MAQDYNNIPAGLRLSTQIPLDVKSYIADEATLAYLGTANNLAYTYVDGMIIYCIAEKTKYVWREVEAGEENTGLVPLDFTYPANSITFGINYSSKKYNFFPIPGGVAVLNDLNDVTIASLANNNLLAYNSTSSQWENETYASLGLQTTITNPVTGYGTTNKIPKYLNASGALVDSKLTDNGTIINSDLPIDITSPSVSYWSPLGAEQLTTSTYTAWTLGSGWGGDVTNGFVHTGGSGVATLTNTIGSVINNYYQITVTVTGRTSGSVQVDFANASLTLASNATSSIGPKAIGSTTLVVTPTSVFDGRVFISIKPITATLPIQRVLNPSGTDPLARIETRSYTGDLRSLFVGVDSGRRVTTGDFNTFFGYTSGSNTTTGNNNTFLGYAAGRDTVTGVYNTFIGSGAGILNTGSNNTAIGGSSAYNLTSGVRNTFLGYNSGTGLTTGAGNTLLGYASGPLLTNNVYNTLVGFETGSSLASGAANVFLGYQAGAKAGGAVNLVNCNNSVFIGSSTRAKNDGSDNEIVIGYSADGEGSNTTVIGSASTTLARIYGKLDVPASTTARAQIKLNTGVAVTTPVDGDIWLESNTSTGLKIKLGGVIYRVSLV